MNTKDSGNHENIRDLHHLIVKSTNKATGIKMINYWSKNSHKSQTPKTIYVRE